MDKSIIHIKCFTYGRGMKSFTITSGYLKTHGLHSDVGKVQRPISTLLSLKLLTFQNNEVVSILCDVRISLLGCVHSAEAPLSWFLQTIWAGSCGSHVATGHAVREPGEPISISILRREVFSVKWGINAFQNPGMKCALSFKVSAGSLFFRCLTL